MANEKFDSQKQYQEQGEVYFDDGREIELLHFVYEKTDLDSIRGSPAKVLAAIDEFARTKKYLMNVGEDKGKIVTDKIAECKPKNLVELGGYIGYSSILFGNALRSAGGQQYFTLERNPEFAAVTASLVDLAGLSDVVKIIVGPSDASIKRLHAAGIIKQVDMFFIDHFKPAYTPDLKLLEELDVVQVGTVLIADNVIKPGNPPYLKYVRNTCEEKRRDYDNATNELDVSFADEGRINNDRTKQGEGIKEIRRGNPNLIYESELVHSFEPSGVPDALDITKCVGIEKTS